MSLNISKGNMYPFISHTWNTIKGKCPHDCSYCYMKQFPQNEIRFDKKELNTDLGEDNFIFVGSSCDMWADTIPEEWILKTLEHCRNYHNTYLFQSKNPGRFESYNYCFKADTVLGTTIETNENHEQMGCAPIVLNRAISLMRLSRNFRTMVTIEPILDFDLVSLKRLIKMCNPAWVNIGADSKGHNLPEPSANKITELIDNLKNYNINVKLKDNLKRLLK